MFCDRRDEGEEGLPQSPLNNWVCLHAIRCYVCCRLKNVCVKTLSILDYQISKLEAWEGTCQNNSQDMPLVTNSAQLGIVLEKIQEKRKMIMETIFSPEGVNRIALSILTSPRLHTL